MEKSVIVKMANKIIAFGVLAFCLCSAEPALSKVVSVESAEDNVSAVQPKAEPEMLIFSGSELNRSVSVPELLGLAKEDWGLFTSKMPWIGAIAIPSQELSFELGGETVLGKPVDRVTTVLLEDLKLQGHGPTAQPVIGDNNNLLSLFLTDVKLVNVYFSDFALQHHYGGAVCSQYQLAVERSVFLNNSAPYGGGAIAGDNVEVVDSVFGHNKNDLSFFDADGGALKMNTGTVRRSVFYNNKSGHRAGAVYLLAGEIAQSLFLKNSANQGGAVTVRDSSILKSSFIGNSAVGHGGTTSPLREGGGAINSFNDLIITSCNFEANYADKHGGAINGSEKLEVSDSIFIRNKADGDGGAITRYGSGAGAILNSSFEHNQSEEKGGAIAVSNNFQVHNSKFIANSAKGGGAVFAQELSVVDCVFSDNNATEQGGALLGAQVELERVTFSANVAAGDGGGIFILDYGLGKIKNSSIEGNKSGHAGGGVAFAGLADLSLEDSIIQQNEAAVHGGGIALLANKYRSEQKLILQNAVLRDNHAKEGYGGAIFIDSSIPDYEGVSKFVVLKADSGKLTEISANRDLRGVSGIHIGQYSFAAGQYLEARPDDPEPVIYMPHPRRCGLPIFGGCSRQEYVPQESPPTQSDVGIYIKVDGQGEVRLNDPIYVDSSFKRLFRLEKEDDGIFYWGGKNEFNGSGYTWLSFKSGRTEFLPGFEGVVSAHELWKAAQATPDMEDHDLSADPTVPQAVGNNTAQASPIQADPAFRPGLDALWTVHEQATVQINKSARFEGKHLLGIYGGRLVLPSGSKLQVADGQFAVYKDGIIDLELRAGQNKDEPLIQAATIDLAQAKLNITSNDKALSGRCLFMQGDFINLNMSVDYSFGQAVLEQDGDKLWLVFNE